MRVRSARTWPELVFESWLLSGEAATVIWLRTMRLMAGGPLAQAEQQRMVNEKVVANLAFLPLLLTGGHQSAQDMAARALAHYARPVRANRRRLSRARR